MLLLASISAAPGRSARKLYINFSTSAALFASRLAYRLNIFERFSISLFSAVRSAIRAAIFDKVKDRLFNSLLKTSICAAVAPLIISSKRIKSKTF